MKNSFAVMLSLLIAGVLCASPAGAQTDKAKSQESSASGQPQNAAPAADAGFKDDTDKISYALGMRMALELKNLRKSIDYNPELIVEGLRDALVSGKTKLTADQRTEVLALFQKNLVAKEEEIKQQMAETNKKEGEAFLAANKTKEGVVTLDSGLQYKILKQGDGPKPTLKDQVVCNYKGTFLDGKEFDSSYKRGKPSTFPLIGVIRGWTEALQLMPVGSKWQLFVPSTLAYGEFGHRPDIQPNSTLIFEVELLSIEAGGQQQQAPKMPAQHPAMN
jgi:FKBP-type peptidyl-prolyl cis-trans isomerase